MIQPSSEWDLFLKDQRDLMKMSLSDPHNRVLAGLAIAGGVISSVALARLYTTLTPDDSDDHFYSVMPKAVFAVGTGLLGVVWYLNKAHAQREAIESLAAMAEVEGIEEGLEIADEEGVLSDGQAESLAGALESSIFDIFQQVT